jgi:hypothetical protein
MQLHHIRAEADGGPDTIENCIPLCLDCHEEVGSYNPKHPIGRKFSEDELRQHRDLWFDFVQRHPERINSSAETFFRPPPKEEIAPSDIVGSVEPHWYEASVWSKKNGHEDKEVFGAKIRNKGLRSLFVDVIGFTADEKRFPGVFSPWSSKDHDAASDISPGHSQIFSFFGVKLEQEDIPKLDGMYLVTGSGHTFVNKQDSLARLIEEFLHEKPDEPPNVQFPIDGSESSVPQLSKEAKRLLIEASASGLVRKINVSGRVLISTHTPNQDFMGDPQDNRLLALWLHAFEELVADGSLESAGGNSYRVTHRGFQLADIFKKNPLK